MPWTCTIDNFAIGCVLAELWLLDPIFERGIESRREHLAIVDKVVGPFPEAFARNVEYYLPGTFSFKWDGRPSVVYPALDTTSGRGKYSNAGA